MTATMTNGPPGAVSPAHLNDQSAALKVKYCIDDQAAKDAFHLDPVFSAGYAAGVAEAAKLAEAKLAESNSSINNSRSNSGSFDQQYFQPPQGFGGAQRPPRFPSKGKSKGFTKGSGLQSFGDVGADSFSYQGQQQGGPGGYVPYQTVGGIATRNPEPAMTMQMPSGNLSHYHRNYFVRPTGVSPNTWRVHGELISRGAKNHPHNCVPCKFYCHGAGCLSGPNCGFCHEFHVSKSKFHAQRRAKGKGKGSSQIPGDMWNTAPSMNQQAFSSNTSYAQQVVCPPAQQPQQQQQQEETNVSSMPAPAPTATTASAVPGAQQEWNRSSSPPLW